MLARNSTLIYLAFLLVTACCRPSSSVADIDSKMERAVSSTGPTSCNDLTTLGYNLNGYYFVNNSTTQAIETTFCDFKKGSQPSLPKKVSVSFDVRRNSSFENPKNIITFEHEFLNVGGAMNASTGIFTAPVAGIYYFSFAAFAKANWKTVVILNKNGRSAGASYSSSDTTNLVTDITLALPVCQVLLKLEANDTVNMVLSVGRLYDDANHYMHFLGFLVEQN